MQLLSLSASSRRGRFRGVVFTRGDPGGEGLGRGEAGAFASAFAAVPAGAFASGFAACEAGAQRPGAWRLMDVVHLFLRCKRMQGMFRAESRPLPTRPPPSRRAVHQMGHTGHEYLQKIRAACPVL